MKLPIEPPLPPMEARSTDTLPEDDGWQYEPKWDGFRCIVFRDGADVYLQSKACKPLTRYFPELVKAVSSLPSKSFVIDGEIVVPEGGTLSFDNLLQRIHPAASRIAKLAAQTPASLIVFDILAPTARTSLLDRPLAVRREKLEAFASRNFGSGGALQLSPATEDVNVAREWLTMTGDLDGIMAKRLDMPYRSGERDAARKLKRMRTADCVVGGFRYASKGRALGSLLLGLYDDEGLLHHVGFSSSFAAAERKRLLGVVEPLIEPPGFTGQAPGGPSRWATDRSADWKPLRPELVVEVQYDHFTGGRFRHGTRVLRWRPDKAPRQCTFAQLH